MSFPPKHANNYKKSQTANLPALSLSKRNASSSRWRNSRAISSRSDAVLPCKAARYAFWASSVSLAFIPETSGLTGVSRPLKKNNKWMINRWYSIVIIAQLVRGILRNMLGYSAQEWDWGGTISGKADLPREFEIYDWIIVSIKTQKGKQLCITVFRLPWKSITNLNVIPTTKAHRSHNFWGVCSQLPD